MPLEHDLEVSRVRRLRVVVRGIVQGVGFRPFVHRLACDLGLAGFVLNSSEGVVAEVEGDERSLGAFRDALQKRPPPMAVVETVEGVFLPPVGHSSFTIEKSLDAAGEFVLVSPDIATCPDCLRELLDPKDRRYRYPFINCTNCGPRFTIIRDIPYDRPKTTMSHFEMCPDCRAEYDDPVDRRFHAQPNACPACGPQVWLSSGDGRELARGDAAVSRTKALLADGKIVAVKGIGGFHLACDAKSDRSVARLRRRKQRVDKPFAVMFGCLESVEECCHLAPGDRQLLLSPQKPIVLVRHRPASSISRLVAPNNRTLGVMLPYTPIHALLLDQGEESGPAPVLVMTSGNRAEEPIAKDNKEALARLGSLTDAFLFHDREIHVSCDDSVTQVVEGREVLRRRARGYAPFPVRLSSEVEPVLAVGPHLKNTFCLARDTYAFVSHHIGDLENLETLTAYEAAIEHFRNLFRVDPKVVAHDLHPDYLSTRFALELKKGRRLRLQAVQHHHAHIVSCLAENGSAGPAIGVAFDGTGFGTDGHVWGGEFLVADALGFKRAAHLKYAVLPGGEAAISRPWRMALSYLSQLDQGVSCSVGPASRLAGSDVAAVREQIERRFNSPWTSSVGRLFDGISSLVGLCDSSTFEGQAAMELEAQADPSVEESYPWGVSGSRFPLVLDWTVPIASVVSDLEAKVPVPVVSSRFHNSLADVVTRVCSVIADRTGVRTVALSGGVFQNEFLLTRTLARLRARDLVPLTHHQVPANDGGVSLGQAVVASARTEAKRR